MKIIDGNAGLVTNYEVLENLKHKVGNRELGAEIAQFRQQVIQYLENTPASQLSTPNIKNFLKAIDQDLKGKEKLTKAEKLQFINLAPTKEVEVHLVVQEIEERVDTKKLLRFTKILLPGAIIDEIDDVGENEEEE